MQVSNMRPLKKRDVAASKACDSTPTIFSFLSSRYEIRGDAKISKAWIALMTSRCTIRSCPIIPHLPGRAIESCIL